MKILYAAIMLLASVSVSAKDVHYELNIAEKEVNFTGKPFKAIAINDQIPAPRLDFVEGDNVVITVKNHLKTSSSIHWHGLLVPTNMDGVPHLSNKPIPAGGEFTFRFPLIYSGTYWYHSHTNLQEQSGMYGAFVVQPKEQTVKYDEDITLVLSDWIDEDPEKVYDNLKRNGHYYLDNINTLGTLIEKVNIKERIDAALIRMEGMDLADIQYDRFLINGKTKMNPDIFDVKAGSKVRFRLINAATSTYFNFNIEGLDMKVIAKDGIDVQPVMAKNILIGMAETYDIEVVADGFPHKIIAETQRGDDIALAMIAEDETRKIIIEHLMPNMEIMDHSNMDMSQMDHSGMDMSSMDHSGMDMSSMDHSSMDMSGMDHSNMSSNEMDHSGMDMAGMDHSNMGAKEGTLKYSELKALSKTTIDSTDVNVINLDLTGSMEDFYWGFNGKKLSMSEPLRIIQGQKVVVNFTNKTMMHHPIHLHGHFFRAEVGNGDYNPLMHTVDIKPMSSMTIEFYAGESGEWFFHCHNLYHAKAGMARVFTYNTAEDEKNDPILRSQLKELRKHNTGMKDSDFYNNGYVDIGHNFDYEKDTSVNTYMRWHNDVNYFELQSEDETIEGKYSYRADNWTKFFVGVEKEDDTKSFVGMNYLFPFFIEAEVTLDDKGEFELALDTEINVSAKSMLELEGNTEGNYKGRYIYRFTKEYGMFYEYDKEKEHSINFRFQF